MRLPELRLWKPRQAGPEDNDDSGDELGEFAPENNEGEGDNDEEDGAGEETGGGGEGGEGGEVGDDDIDPDTSGPERPEEGGGGDEGDGPTRLPSDRPTAGGGPPTPPLTLPSTPTPQTLSLPPVPSAPSEVSDLPIVGVPSVSSLPEIDINTVATFTAPIRIAIPSEAPVAAPTTSAALQPTSSALAVIAAELASPSSASPLLVLSLSTTEPTFLPLATGSTAVVTPVLSSSTDVFDTPVFSDAPQQIQTETATVIPLVAFPTITPSVDTSNPGTPSFTLLTAPTPSPTMPAEQQTSPVATAGLPTAGQKAGIAVGSIAGLAFLATALLMVYKWRRGTLPRAVPATARRLTAYWRVSTWTPPPDSSREPSIMEKALLPRGADVHATMPVVAPPPPLGQHFRRPARRPPSAVAPPRASVHGTSHVVLPPLRTAPAAAARPVSAAPPSLAGNPLALNPVAESGGLWLDFGDDGGPWPAPPGGGNDALRPPMPPFAGEEVRNWSQRALDGGQVGDEKGEIGRGL